MLRWLIVPYRSRLVNFASKPFYQVADRILGTQFLDDVAEFFILFQSMYDGFVERAKAVHRLMADRRTSFIVVSTLEAVPLREAEFFAQALNERRLHLGAIVLNKVLPAYLRDPQGAAVAETPARPGRRARRVRRPQGALGRRQPRSAGCCPRWAAAIWTTGWWPSAKPRQQAELATVPEALVSVPYFETDVFDLAGLLRLGDNLWGAVTPVGPKPHARG